MCDKVNCINLEARGLRVLLIGLSVLFIVFSVTLMTIGILCRTLYSNYFQVYQSSMDSVPVLLIVIGFIFMAITIVGFVGTVLKNKIMLVLYAGMVGIMIFFEIGATLTCAVFQSQMTSTVNVGLKKVISSNSTVMETIQNNFGCCGIHSVADYNNNNVPPSCCNGTGTCTAANAIPMGCLSVLVAWSLRGLGMTIGIIVGAIFLEICTMVTVGRLYHLLKITEKPA